jgi:hypothetical protein
MPVHYTVEVMNARGQIINANTSQIISKLTMLLACFTKLYAQTGE